MRFFTHPKTMTTVTIPERIMMNEDVEKPRSLH